MDILDNGQNLGPLGLLPKMEMIGKATVQPHSFDTQSSGFPLKIQYMST